ncbi:MAG TPA: TSUP family transporter, partial [Armatimonadota bacterium]|nr:TSUP family transporter [Armatimonadota bacterium]
MSEPVPPEAPESPPGREILEAAEPREITRAPVTAFVLGWTAGVFSALLGVGGGLLMVPGMAFLLRLRQHRAVGTSLAVILPTAI